MKTDSTECWGGGGATGISYIAGGDLKWKNYFWETVWQRLIKSDIPLLGIYLRQRKSVHKSLCVWMFVAVVFIAAKTRLNRHLSSGEWINKQVHPYTGKDSNTKKQTTDTQQRGWISNVFCWVKKARLQRLHERVLRIVSNQGNAN